NNDFVDVFTIGVLDPAAAPPPGITRWPAKGEVFASAALINRIGSSSFIERYGTLVGTIETAALADPGERILYVGAEANRMDPDRSYVISSFGDVVSQNETGYFGSAFYQQVEWHFYVGLSLFGLAPALVLGFTALRLGNERRIGRLATLRIIGAPPAVLRRLTARTIAAPTLIGVAVAVFGGALACLGTWWLPFSHFAVVGTDLRRMLWTFPLIGLLVATAFISYGWYMFRARAARPQGTRPVVDTRRAALWPLAVLCLIVLAAFWLFEQIYPVDPGAATMVVVGCGALAVAFASGATAALVRIAAHLLIAFGTRRSAPAALLVGRDLQVLSKPIIRTSVGLCAAMIIGVQVAVWAAVPDVAFREAKSIQQQNAGKVLTVGVVPNPAELRQIDADLPAGAVMLLSDPQLKVVSGTCAALQAVIGVCDGAVPGQTPLAQARLWFDTTWQVAQYDSPESVPRTEAIELGIFAADGQPLNQDQVATAFHKHVAPPLSVEPPLQGWVVGAKIDVDHARWFQIGGVLAVGLVAIAGSFAMHTESTRLARRFASLGVLVDKTATYRSLAFGIAGLPLALAGLNGIVTAMGLVAAPILNPTSDAAAPKGLLFALPIIVAVLTACMAGLTGRTLRLKAACWVVGEEED
ncbi:MAG: hypothetical protein LBG70_01760, partial [Bifidobacteriaceae bacterium]|nr:hypothetical protein [Bifidobacteriaceae bacterium]